MVAHCKNGGGAAWQWNARCHPTINFGKVGDAYLRSFDLGIEFAP